MSDTPPVRVAYLGHVARLSGAEIALLRLLRAAGDRVEATVILAEDGELVQPLRDARARVEVLPLAEGARGLQRGELRAGRRQAGAALELSRYVLRLRKRLRELEPDLVHTSSLKASVYGTLAARLARRPVLWHLHDRLATDYLPPAVVPGMRLLAASAPDALVANSRMTLETVGARFRRGMMVAVVPNAIPYPERPVELRERVETVAMVGRLTAWKGQHVFLEAFADAFDRDSAVRARLIGAPLFGEEDYERRLRELAARLGIADRVDFAGFTADVSGELARADLLVHASTLPEPLGQVVLEGMAAGVPVVAAAAGAPAEYVRDGREGLLHRPGDAGDLADALRRAAADPELRSRIAVAGRERAREFAPDVVARRWMALYRELTASGA